MIVLGFIGLIGLAATFLLPAAEPAPGTGVPATAAEHTPGQTPAIVDLTQGLVDLVAVALVAALAPLVIAVLPGPRFPQVVIFLIGGVLIGPDGLGLAETANITLLSNIGLGFLFLLAGDELDPLLLRQRPGSSGSGLADLGCDRRGGMAGLGAAGYIKDYVPVGLALTTTALGMLLPILRDNDMLNGPSASMCTPGGTGELFPYPGHRVFLTAAGQFRRACVGGPGRGARHRPVRRPWLARNRPVQRIIREGQDATGQTTLRWALALLFLLLACKPVRPRCRARRPAGRDGAAPLDPPDEHGYHWP